MREILFRGQTRRYGEKLMNVAGDKMPSNWVYGGIFPNNVDNGFAIIYQQYPDIEKFPVYADTVGQYTGVVDKNGVKIFESDIVQFVAGIENGIFEVEYARSEFFANWIVKNNFMDLMTSMKYLQCSSELEVVGNAFDDPELLDIGKC